MTATPPEPPPSPSPLKDYADNAKAAVPTPVREEPDPEAKPT